MLSVKLATLHCMEACGGMGAERNNSGLGSLTSSDSIEAEPITCMFLLDVSDAWQGTQPAAGSQVPNTEAQREEARYNRNMLNSRQQTSKQEASVKKHKPHTPASVLTERELSAGMHGHHCALQAGVPRALHSRPFNSNACSCALLATIQVPCGPIVVRFPPHACTLS